MRATFLILASILCLSSIARAASTIRIGTANSIYNDLLTKIAPAFEKKTGIKLTYVHDTTQVFPSQLSMKAVITGESDMGITATFIEDWIKVTKEKFPELDTSVVTHRVVGKEMILVVSNKDVGVTKLTMPQIEGLFLGKIKNWKEVGGKDIAVFPFLQEGAVARNDVFKKRILKGKDFAPNTKQVNDFKEIRKLLSSQPGALSILSKSHITTEDMLVQEHEEIGRPIVIITKGKPSEDVLKLIQFIENEGKQLTQK